MKKMFLGLLLGASAVMADVSTNHLDLLSVATAGKSTGTQFEMKKEDMQKADGGYYSYTRIGSSYYNSNTIAGYSSTTTKSSIYARAWGSYYWGRSW
ncbi:MAG: hypothetical protein WC667_11155 [Sulfurimonas sp.]|jgi:hypothetical protein